MIKTEVENFAEKLIEAGLKVIEVGRDSCYLAFEDTVKVRISDHENTSIYHFSPHINIVPDGTESVKDILSEAASIKAKLLNAKRLYKRQTCEKFMTTSKITGPSSLSGIVGIDFEGQIWKACPREEGKIFWVSGFRFISCVGKKKRAKWLPV